MHTSRPNFDRKPHVAFWQQLGRCALLAALLASSGCAWFKPKDPGAEPEVNFRDDPKATSIRPKREGGKHLYGGLSSEANAIERNLGY